MCKHLWTFSLFSTLLLMYIHALQVLVHMLLSKWTKISSLRWQRKGGSCKKHVREEARRSNSSLLCLLTVQIRQHLSAIFSFAKRGTWKSLNYSLTEMAGKSQGKRDVALVRYTESAFTNICISRKSKQSYGKCGQAEIKQQKIQVDFTKLIHESNLNTLQFEFLSLSCMSPF